MAEWIVACGLDELGPGEARLLRHAPEAGPALQVALFRTEQGTPFAVDNLCPHEGYPLVQGDRADCTLTCAWHNWKFDLRSGENLKGGEDVRTFPVRIVGDRVEVDLSPPDPAAETARVWRSLDRALFDHDNGRACRDAVRLLQLGVAPAALAVRAAAFDGARAEYGSTHALPVAADVLRLCAPGPPAVLALAQAFDLASQGSVRRPRRPLADPAAVSDPAATGAALRAAVEAEDAAAAESLLRGALAAGWGRDVLEPWFLRLCADHFLSFGHRLIYTSKVFDLLDAAAWRDAEPVLCGLLFGIVNGTREDVLPLWKPWRKRIDALDLPALHAVPDDPAWRGGEAVQAAVVGGRQADAVDAVVQARAAGAPLSALVDALSLAASERMLRFDVAIDGDDGNQDGWLSVTHTQTFAAALRPTVARWRDPAVLRLLLQSARFTNHHRTLDGARPDTTPRPGSADAVLAAIDAGDAARAVALAGSLPDGLADALQQRCLRDVTGAPIVQAHVLKNTLVALDETTATGDPRPVQALVRLLASPLQQRWVHRTAQEALAFVTEGRKPRLLAP